ncbi:class I SAM-dependent methyltransferase [Pseudonocardia sp. GCM10023141]|uniref:class I SAM-dependent methyltransferase n=1 Tax=Pseudonocardia sp. GCM10023141 TaxID=3252653 RepID=UPI00360EFE37
MPPAKRAVKLLRGAVEARLPQAAQGRHVDPADQLPVDPASWGAAYATAFASPEMSAFRENLRIPGRDLRESVLDDLATYHGITPEEARLRCLTWEERSVQEWEAANADDDAGRVAFYRTMQSWSYDLLWWAYLQAEMFAEPSSVMALRFLQANAAGRRHLDFGAGVGATSQLFVANGWVSTLADLSSTLLEFARFRLERRDQVADYLDLHRQALPAGAYDAITAIDTLAHVPDVHRTACELRGALSRDGILIANFDIRSPAPETAWHLHDDDLRARHDLLRAGFCPITHLGGGLIAYRRVDDYGLARARRTVWDWATLVSPPRRIARALPRRALTRTRSLLGSRHPPTSPG